MERVLSTISRLREIRKAIRYTNLEGLLEMRAEMLKARRIQTPYDLRFMWELCQEIAYKRRP